MKTYYAVLKNNQLYAILESIPELIEYAFPMVDDFEEGNYFVLEFYKSGDETPRPEDYTITESQVDWAALRVLLILHDYVNVIDYDFFWGSKDWSEFKDYGFVISGIDLNQRFYKLPIF